MVLFLQKTVLFHSPIVSWLQQLVKNSFSVCYSSRIRFSPAGQTEQEMKGATVENRAPDKCTDPFQETLGSCREVGGTGRDGSLHLGSITSWPLDIVNEMTLPLQAEALRLWATRLLSQKGLGTPSAALALRFWDSQVSLCDSLKNRFSVCYSFVGLLPCHALSFQGYMFQESLEGTSPADRLDFEPSETSIELLSLDLLLSVPVIKRWQDGGVEGQAPLIGLPLTKKYRSQRYTAFKRKGRSHLKTGGRYKPEQKPNPACWVGDP